MSHRWGTDEHRLGGEASGLSERVGERNGGATSELLHGILSAWSTSPRGCEGRRRLMMKLLASFRFSCSHNAFDVSDAGVEPWREPSELDGLPLEAHLRFLQRGWYKRGRSICFRTLVQSYDNRIDVLRSASHSVPPEADRVLAFNISLPSGTLMVLGLDHVEHVSVGAGDHTLYCRAFNLGVEPPPEAPLLDDGQFLRRNDLERFELVLVPGSVNQEGVIHGSHTLSPRTS